MHYIFFSIQAFLKVYGTRLLSPLPIVLQKSVPVLICSILTSYNFLTVQVKSLLPFRFWHRPMHEGLIARLDVILRRPVPLFDLP